MKRSTIGLIVIAALVVIILLTGVSSYNGLVSSETSVDSKFADVDVQLQRRLNLIPNLVNTVKGYAAHEEKVFTAIADARKQMAGAATPEQKVAADASMTSALSRLLVVVENYPNLKADAQFTGLRDELAGTENRIAVGRKDYNDAVTSYNVKIRSFPGSIFAGMFGFQKKPFFTAQEGANIAPEVKF